MRKQIALSLALVATFGAAASAPAQFGGKPSAEQQMKLGKQAADEIRKKEKVLPDSDVRVRLLRRVGQRLLAQVSTKEPWEWTFDVIESKEVNAFALPGGSTFFYTGLLDKFKTEDEVAGVVGHEMTHVIRQHWANRVAEQQRRNLLLSLGLMVFKAPSTVANVAGLTNGLISLQYGRGDEGQADQGGFDLMNQAGYNPEGMANAFRILQAQQKGGAPPEFLSDHPSDKNRINRIESNIRKANRTYPAERPLPWAKPE